MAMKIDNDISSRVRNRITEVDKEKQAREAARAKTEPIPVNKVTTPVTPKKVTPLPQNVQNGFNIITSQIAQNTQNYQKYGTPINRNNIVPETPTRIVTAYDKNGNQVETKQPETYYNPNKALLKKDETGKNVLEKTAEDKEFAEKHTTLGIGKDKKSYIPQALSAGTWSASNALINAPRVIGDVFETLNNKFVSPNLKTDNPDAFVKVPSQESIKAARSDYETIRNYYGQHAEEAQNTLMRMTANSQAQQQIANLVQSVPEMAAIAAVSYMSGGLAGATLGADLIGGTLATGAVVDNTISGMIGRIIKQYANNPTFWSSMATQAAHVSEDAKAAGADPFTALTATALIGPLNAAIETAGGIGSGEDDLLKILTKGQLAKATVNTALEEGLEEVKQGGVQELVFQALGINPVKPFTNELERKLGIPQRGINAYASTEAYDAANETPAVIDPSRMAQEFAGGALMGGAMSLPGHAVNYQVNKNNPQPIPVNVPGARYEATENGFGTNGSNPLAKENLRATTLPKNITKEEMIQEISDITEGMYPTEELQGKTKNELKEMLTEFRRINEKPDTQPIPVNQQIQQNYDQTGDIREALQGVDNKQQNIPYNFDLNTKEGRMAAKVTDEKTENQLTALSKVFKRNIRFATDFDEGVHGKHDLSTGDIVLNANSIKNGESVTRIVLGHELTHGLEKTKAYAAMSKLVEKYVDSQDGVKFKDQVEKLRNSYQNEIKGMSEEDAYEYLKQEYIAEFAGNFIFNNEEFIARLCKEDRTTFERVKEWIQDTISKLTSNDDTYKMLIEARRLYDKAARQSVKSNNQSNAVKYSKEVDDSGNEYVLLEENILDGKMPGESQADYIMDYIATNIGNVYEIVSDKTPVYIGNDLPGEYYYSKDSQYKRSYRKDLAYAKLQAAQDIGEIVEIAQGRKFEQNRKQKHNVDAKNGFYKYSSRFGVKDKNNSKAKIFDCTLIIRNAADGKSYLYDIIVNKKVGTHSLTNTSQGSGSHVAENSAVALPTTTSIAPSETKDNSIPYNFTTKTWSTDAYSGQVDMRKTIYAGNKEIGYLEYSVYNDEPSVQYIHVDPEYRRKGAAKQLMQELQKEFPDAEINFGMTTDDGTKLLEGITEERTNQDIVDKKAELRQIEEELKSIENKLDEYADQYVPGERTEEQQNHIDELGERWDELYRRQRQLEEEVRGKSETSTYIKMSKGSGINAQTEEETNLYNKLNQNNGISFNQNTDNKGRTLSAGQKQYFQYAKTRDAAGNLKTYYHGSPNEFDTFDIKKARSNGTYGKGFYFSESDSHAGQYGKQMEVYLNITNPVQNDTNAITKEQLRDFIQELADNEDDYGIDNYGYDATVDSVLDSVWGKTDFQMLLDLNASCVGNMVEAVKLFNEVNGTDYDGIIAPTETVAFYPEQIKQVTNQNPTTNPSTKLSKGTGIEAQSEAEADLYNKLNKSTGITFNQNTDSEGRTLSEQQKKYFGQSKVRDENGNLMVMYHGTENSGFKVFDPDISSDGLSMFFTNELEIARSYAGNSEIYAPGNFDTIEKAKQYILEKTDYVVDIFVNDDGNYQINEDGDYAVEQPTLADAVAEYVEDYVGVEGGSMVYGTYLDIKNPLVIDADGKQWDELPNIIDESGEAMTTNQYAEYAHDNGYDGVIFNNIFDTGRYGGSRQKDTYATNAVVFNSNQIKSINNTNPTENSDIRYSKGASIEANTSEEEKLYSKLAGEAKTKKKFTGKGKVEAAKELVAVHNINGSDLVKSFELGGLPMPSIAILKANQGHSLFGNISLVFDKDTIDPKANKDNKIYSGDAYTPTFPQVSVRVNPEKANQISEWATDILEKIPDYSQHTLNNLRYDVEDTIDRAGGAENYIENMLYDADMKQVYLADTGRETVPIQTRQVEVKGSEKRKALYEYSIEDLGESFMQEYDNVASTENADDFWETNKDHIIDIMKQATIDAGFLRGIAEKQTPDRWKIKFNEAYDYWKNGEQVQYRTENDYAGTRKLIDETVDMGDYKAWLTEKFGNIVDKKGIRNDKELFTPSGYRRSWEQLHYELNLENVVKAMKAENDQGIGGLGMQSIFGGSAESLGSIDEVRNRSGQLQIIPEEEYEAMRKDFSERFFELTHDIVKHKDSFTAADEAANTFIDGLIKYKTKSAMNNYYKREFNGWANYDEYVLDDFLEIVDGIRQMPTGYFEAKPKRAVSFGEAKAAIVPSDINPELVSKLEEYGTEVHMYETGNEEQRRNILNSLDALKFRKAEGITADTEAEKQMYSNLERSSQITSRKFQRQQAIPYNRPTENVAPEEETVAKAPENVATTQKTVAEAPETRKAQEYTRRSAKQFRENLLSDFKADRFANNTSIKGYVDEIVNKLKTGTLTSADRDNMFYNILSAAEVLNQDNADMYSEVIKELKGRPLYVSQETSRNITDYPQFRRNSKLSLSSKGGSTISDVYYSIEERYPGIFRDETGRPIEPNTQEEMLEALDTLYNKAQSDMYTPLTNTEYILQDGAIEAYRADFDKEIDALEREVNIAKRYNTFRAGKTVKEVSDDYENLNKYKRAADKVKQNVILTDEDRADLELLHKGSITEAQLRRRSENADNILRVYEAEKPVRAIQQKIKETGEKTHAMYFDKADKALETSDLWKSAKSGLKLFTDTAERNVRMIAGKDSQKVIDEYFTPVHTNEANSNRMKNDYRNVVRGLNIDTEERYDITDLPFDAPGLNEIRQEQLDKKKRLIVSESALVQLYGEGKINEDDLNSISADVEKIQNCVNTMRSLYEQMYEASNEVLIQHGYEPIAHRENYFPHFTEDEPDGVLGAMAKALGFDVQLDELPTDISGLTQGFRPGKKWWGNILQRNSDITEYDALKGFDRYLEGAGDVIFHTADIQKLRALENTLRYKYSEKGVQEQLDAIRKDKTLDENQKQKARDELYERNIRQHGKFAEWIRDYTDTLAGKKSFLDRPFEKLANRAWYSGLKNLENRLAANMVAINPGSWLTNFIPLVQSSEIKNSNIIRGMAATIQSYRKDDGFADRSTFITNRRGSDTLWSSTTDRVVGALASPMELIDSFTSQSITRAKYLQEIQNGKSDYAAMKAADRYAADVIADRSKGAMPLVFEARNPVVKALTMFQIEVKNQWSHLFKDIPATEKNVAKVAYAYAKFAIGAYIFNDVYEKLVGRRSALDPISWLNDALKDTTGTRIPNFIDAISALLTDDDDDDENALERFMELFNEGEARSRLQSVIQTGEPAGGGKALENLKSNIVQDIPFVGGLMGGGRIPLMSLADPEKVGKTVEKFGDAATHKTTWEDALRTAGKNVVIPIATYGVLPAGGGQIKKAAESTYDIIKGGNYLTKADGEKELRYAVDDTYMNWLKGLMFGQYALEGGKEYIDSGFKRLNVNATTAYDAIKGTEGLANSEAEAIIKDVVTGKNKAEKINNLKSSKLSTEQKQTVAEILELTTYDKKDIDYGNGTLLEVKTSEPKQETTTETTTQTKEEKRKLPGVDFNNKPKETEYKGNYKYQKKVDSLTATGLSKTEARDVTDKVMRYDNPYSKVLALADTNNYSDAACEALGIPKYAYKEGRQKIEMAIDAGITPQGYANRFDAANTDGNSSVNQTEAKAYLDGLSMSRADKALWWKILTGGSDKRNPYK